jgi:hypothetical protein
MVFDPLHKQTPAAIAPIAGRDQISDDVIVLVAVEVIGDQ